MLILLFALVSSVYAHAGSAFSNEETGCDVYLQGLKAVKTVPVVSLSSNSAFDHTVDLFRVTPTVFQVLVTDGITQTSTIKFFDFDGNQVTKLAELPRRAWSAAALIVPPGGYVPPKLDEYGSIIPVLPKIVHSFTRKQYIPHTKRTGKRLPTAQLSLRIWDPAQSTDKWISIAEGTYSVEVDYNSFDDAPIAFTAMAMSPNEENLVLAYSGAIAKLAVVDVTRGRLKQILNLQGLRDPKTLNKLMFSPNGEYLLAFDFMGVTIFKVREDGALQMLITLDDEVAAAGRSEWRRKNGGVGYQLNDHYYLATDFRMAETAVFSPDGKKVVLAKSNGSIKIVTLAELPTVDDATE